MQADLLERLGPRVQHGEQSVEGGGARRLQLGGGALVRVRLRVRVRVGVRVGVGIRVRVRVGPSPYPGPKPHLVRHGGHERRVQLALEVEPAQHA